MLRIIFYILLTLSLFLYKGKASEYNHFEDPNLILDEMSVEISEVRSYYQIKESKIIYRIETINENLKKDISLEMKVNFLVEKDSLRDELQKLAEDEYSEISKIRYLKGMQVLKLLYEKILSLDHHFTSVYTLSEINKITNPNTYPEFQKVRDLVKDKKNKKLNLELPGLLAENPFISVAHTFVNMLGVDFSSNSKKEELRNIECILDFTTGMQNELNTIYFETTFLQAGAEALKAEIEELFLDYVQPIGYELSLQECRNKDDWDKIRIGLDNYLKDMAEAKGRDQFRKHVDIEFPIDRLLRFIESYNDFISQSEQFYRKFKIILNSYENADQCQSQLPPEYTKLKGDIDMAIDKFNIAYKPVEINGSKMKEILYGLNEFE